LQPTYPLAILLDPLPDIEAAHRNGRMQLIDGRNLKALLKEHLNMDVLIGLPKTGLAAL
jgi:hypothetical protein